METLNEKLADAFNEIADLMAILNENGFKIRAYRDAARRLKEDIHELTKADMDKKELKKIPKIGDALADKMIEFSETGHMEYLEKLRDKIPKPVRDMLDIPHLGPNRVRDLFQKLNIQSKDDLLKHAKNGDIAELDGFGDKLVESILNAIESGQEKKKRHNREDVEPIAKQLTELIKKVKGVKAVEVAGSYRRGKPTIGDLDILIAGNPDFKKIESEIEKTFEQMTWLAQGETKIAFVMFPENLQVDIRLVPESSYGAALLYFTGSKDFNVHMRRIAIEKGYLLNEYGLLDAGEPVAGKTEKEVFEKLDMKFVEPTDRN